jgi:hypothetical protein
MARPGKGSLDDEYCRALEGLHGCTPFLEELVSPNVENGTECDWDEANQVKGKRNERDNRESKV